jgi:hypothetical protein
VLHSTLANRVIPNSVYLNGNYSLEVEVRRACCLAQPAQEVALVHVRPHLVNSVEPAVAELAMLVR